MLMKNRIDQAVEFFSKGFNCSQSIFGTYAPLYGMEEKTAFKTACGFGGGMRFQNTCGAVTGAYMVIGLVFGKWREDDDESKPKTYSMVKQFAHEFIKVNGSINCLELLGCDLKEAGEKDLFRTKCVKYIKDAAEIIERVIILQQNNLKVP